MAESLELNVDTLSNHIFLSLSTDGVQAFRSSQYSYWPIVIKVLNLPPFHRSKVANMLPVIIVPGPKAPVDIVSFMEPLFRELEELQGGKSVRLWDKTTIQVKVNLFFAEGDLQAINKLTNLNGVNGKAPCRFCDIFGVYDPSHKHCYFPDTILKICDADEQRKTQKKRLWNPRSLELRDEKTFLAKLGQIRQLEEAGRTVEAADLAKRAGVKSGELTKLVERMSLMKPFRSFPIDTMHLLYLNIAKNLVSIWLGEVSGLDDVAVLKNKRAFQQVEEALEHAGGGIGGHLRRSRGFSRKGMWKAAEWKFFVHFTSMAVLDEVIPEDMLKGWWKFVQLCELLGRWELHEHDVKRIGSLAVDFYEHYARKYYKNDPSRLNLCKYVYHLLLHLEASIRDCGPLSLLSQWGMENYLGDLNRRCNAKHLFAESVMENVKIQAAARAYSLRESIHIPRLDPDEDVCNVSEPLRCESNLPLFEGFSFRHPRMDLTVAAASDLLECDIKKSLVECYVREFNITLADATREVTISSSVAVWSRLHDEKAANHAPTTYKGLKSYEGRDARYSCYIAGSFAGTDGYLDVYYGRALAFISHRLGGSMYMFALCDWVQSGLKVNSYRQVYVNRKLNNPSLFSGRRLDSVHTISHQIAVMEATKGRTARKMTRTYFLDEMREPRYSQTKHFHLYNSSSPSEQIARFRMKGIS